jgi:hypothetical protein
MDARMGRASRARHASPRERDRGARVRHAGYGAKLCTTGDEVELEVPVWLESGSKDMPSSVAVYIDYVDLAGRPYGTRLGLNLDPNEFQSVVFSVFPPSNRFGGHTAGGRSCRG